jgi:hypothetical protein
LVLLRFMYRDKKVVGVFVLFVRRFSVPALAFYTLAVLLPGLTMVPWFHAQL